MRSRLFLAASAVLFTTPLIAFAAPTVTVVAASAPNADGSPSYDGWVTNALAGIQAGFVATGNPASPTYYTPAPAVMPVSDAFVTDFPLWQGDANPSGDFGAAFANELGNRIHFGADILGNGTKISLSEVSASLASSDGNVLAFDLAPGDLGDGVNYGDGYIGIDYGPDGIKGTADDSIVSSGPNTQLVDELVLRGPGNAYELLSTDPGATNQDKVDNLVGEFDDELPINFTGTISLNLPGGGVISNSDTVVFVPEPGVLSLLAGGFLLTFRRRRR